MTFAREGQSVTSREVGQAALDPVIRNLLDHIATELAGEYVRLMEVAAKTEVDEEAKR